MIPSGLFTQTILLIVAITIIATYVQPTFLDIGTVQDEIATYQEERQKVASVNSQLAAAVAQLESVSREERAKLERYLPERESYDEIAVSRDLTLITQQAEVSPSDISYQGLADSSGDPEMGAAIVPIRHLHSLSVQGTYAQLKTLLSLLEQNSYPLVVRELQVQQVDGGFLNASLQIVTYAFNPGTADEQINL